MLPSHVPQAHACHLCKASAKAAVVKVLRKEKTTIFGVNVMGSQVLYWAAQDQGAYKCSTSLQHVVINSVSGKAQIPAQEYSSQCEASHQESSLA